MVASIIEYIRSRHRAPLRLRLEKARLSTLLSPVAVALGMTTALVAVQAGIAHLSLEKCPAVVKRRNQTTLLIRKHMLF